MANSEARTSSDVARASEGEYQVFLNFRGPDTRYGFTDFLYHGLVNAGVRVFKVDDELRTGEVIGENLLHAINNSTLYISIFSRTYASSKWCLQELALIVDNVSKSGDQKSILPIFLDVEPEDVKLRTPLYNTAFEKHKDFPKEVEAWRKALAEIDEIQGWNVKKDQSQAAIVKLVVEKVLQKLESKSKSATEYLVGLDDRVKDFIKLLDVDHRDVRLIGIYGKGGIGKTTFAKVIFNKLSSHFGKCCSFLENVRERLSTEEGIVELQRKFLSDIVGFGSVEQLMDNEQAMRRIGDTLSTKKILVIMDDVDKKEHIKKLIGGYSLHSGSRIIITTRNKTVLNVKGLKDEILCYEMLKMDDDVALQLFRQHAFDGEFSSDIYRGLSSKIVTITGGLPLIVEVIGSLLNGKDESFWKEMLVRLREVPEEDIMEMLKISYDNLDKYQQQIFLDIACLLLNESKTDASYMWADCQFYPIRGLKVLTHRCLIKLDNDKIWMHDQLIDLGKHIVCQESPFNPGKRSRLWIAQEALEIIRTIKRKEEVQALKTFKSSDSIEITNEDFERLQNLRFLELNGGTYVGDFAGCHSNLRWFSWHSPRDFRADNMYLDHLVVCKLDAIDFKDDSKAWDLIKRAHNLKVLSITRCSGITTIPDFSKCLRLERLTLAYCFSLEIIESFIGDLGSLIELKIKECRGLTGLPEEVGALVKLKQLSLTGCRGLRELPSSLENLISLTELDLSDTIIRELPNSIGKLKSLHILRLSIGASVYQEDHVWQLPRSISTLVNLEELDLSGHDVIGEIPIGIGELSFLRILKLERTHICKIPATINMLHRLQTLNLRSCHEIQVLPRLPTSLTCLLLQSESLLSVPNLSNLTNLVELLLSNGASLGKKSNLVPGYDLSWLGRLCRLKRLELDMLNVPAPPELASLSDLEELKLSCLDLESLMQHPSSLWNLRNLSTLEFNRCDVEDIPLYRLPRLEELTVCRCKQLRRLSIPLELRKLRQMCVSCCPQLVEIQVEHLSQSLESLNIYECESLTKIGGLSYAINLEYMRIQKCKQLTNVGVLNDLESLKSLEVTECPSLRRLINASCTNIPHNCLVKIQGCGDFFKDSTLSDPLGMPLLRYVQEILLYTSNSESKSNETEGKGKATACWMSKESCTNEDEQTEGGERTTAWRRNKDSFTKEKEMGKKKEEPPVTTVVLKFSGGGLHCDRCIKKIRKIITRTKGVLEVAIDRHLGTATVKVKGVMDDKAMAEMLSNKIRRKVEIVPPKEKKEGGEATDKKGSGEDKKGGDCHKVAEMKMAPLPFPYDYYPPHPPHPYYYPR